MKMTKRIVSILLVAMMLLTLAACGSKEDLKGEVSDNNISAPSTDVNASVITDTTTGETGETEEFQAGSVTGKTYENKSLGLGINLPGDWTFLSAKELAEQNGITYSGSGPVESGNVLYEAMGISGDKTSNIIVNFEDLGAVNGLTMTAESYIDIVLPQLEKSYTDVGMTLVNSGKIDVTIGGKTFKAIKVECDYNGVKVYQNMICVKTGKYMGVIGISGTGANQMDTLLSSFYLV